jgi:cholesterol transport system auxiliary component
MKATWRILTSTTVLLILCGCLGITKKHAPSTVYAPTLAHSATASGAPLAWQLLVDVPGAVDPLDGTHIVVMPQPGIVQFYKDVRWRERMPVLLQSMLLQEFQESGRLLGVSSLSAGLRGDYALHLDLSDFQAEYRGASNPTVVIRLNAQLTKNATNRVIAARSFSWEQASGEVAIGAVVTTFEQGLNIVLPQVVEWTLKSGEADWQSVAAQSR